MTKLALALSLLLSLPAFGQAKDAGYTITVHVTESRVGTACTVVKGGSECDPVQQLTALVNGVKYELESKTMLSKGIVALGDYKAKLASEKTKPTGEFDRSYQLMFPDGSTRKFRVTGVME